MHLIDIIIPTRDRCEMFEFALRSVIDSDKLDNYRVVVQDNSATDQNAERNRYLCTQYENVYYDRSPGNISMTDNWAAGLSRCTGKFFLRLDDDNFLLASSISKLLSTAMAYPHCSAFQFNSL